MKTGNYVIGAAIALQLIKITRRQNHIAREKMQLFGSTEETSSREPSGTQSSNGEWSQRFVEHSWILFNTILSFR